MIQSNIEREREGQTAKKKLQCSTQRWKMTEVLLLSALSWQINSIFVFRITKKKWKGLQRNTTSTTTMDKTVTEQNEENTYKCSMWSTSSNIKIEAHLLVVSGIHYTYVVYDWKQSKFTWMYEKSYLGWQENNTFYDLDEMKVSFRPTERPEREDRSICKKGVEFAQYWFVESNHWENKNKLCLLETRGGHSTTGGYLKFQITY